MYGHYFLVLIQLVLDPRFVCLILSLLIDNLNQIVIGGVTATDATRVRGIIENNYKVQRFPFLSGSYILCCSL